MKSKRNDWIKKVLTEECLIRKATTHLGIELEYYTEKYSRGSHTEILGSYNLNDEFIKVLEENGFEFYTNKGFRTLEDKNPQEVEKGWSLSNWWGFGKKGELLIKLYLNPQVSRRQKGVVFYPLAHATSSSPIDKLPRFRFFKAVSNYHKEAHPLIHRLVREEGTILVNWKEIGFEGIKTIWNIFYDFTGNKKMRRDLLSSRFNPYNPSPKEYVNKYLPKNLHSVLSGKWKNQFEEFAKEVSLAI